MTEKRSLGIWSGNEIFARKKNVAEDIKLQSKITCLSMDHLLMKEATERDLRGMRTFLKDVRMSTGHSKEGMVVPEPRSVSFSSHLSVISYDVPGRLLQRSERSFILRPRGSVIYEISQAVKDDTSKTASLTKTETEVSEDIQPGSLTADSPKTTPSLDPKSKTRPPKSDHGSQSQYLAVDELPRMNSQVSHPNKNHEPGDTNSETSDDEDERIKAFLRLNTKYNPWNIQQPNGTLYDALELPRIKDCYRPACRLSCTTCMSRKHNAPCFVIPGITHPSGYVMPLPKSTQKKKKESKKRQKSKLATSKNKSHCEHITSDADTAGGTHGHVGEHASSNDTDLSLQQKLKFLINTTSRCINKTRLEELAKPKAGLRAQLRYSKTFIKREVKKMTKKNAAIELSAVETENRRRIDSRIHMFLAMLNSKDIKMPSKMVHIPLREDVMQVDISHLETVEIPTHLALPKISNKRKVHFD